MVKINSTSRFPRLADKIILTQTDTTVGFLSQDAQKLAKIKSRPPTKPFIKVYANFKALSKELRVPQKRKNLIRRAKKTTFIVKNQAFRVSNHTLASEVLQKSSWFYSTSANESGKKYDREFCEQKADIIIQDRDGLYEAEASSLFKLSDKKIRKLR